MFALSYIEVMEKENSLAVYVNFPWNGKTFFLVDNLFLERSRSYFSSYYMLSQGKFKCCWIHVHCHDVFLAVNQIQCASFQDVFLILIYSSEISYSDYLNSKQVQAHLIWGAFTEIS